MTHAAPPRQGRPGWPGAHHAAPAAAHPALRALLDVAALTPAQAATATVQDLSRAHSVWSVSGPDLDPVVVKTGAAHGGPQLAIECLVYRMTVWCDELAQALPPALLVDEDRQVLVLADVASREAAGSLAMAVGPPPLVARGFGQQAPAGSAHPVDLPAVAARLGRRLGAVHRATAGLPLPPARPATVLAMLLEPAAGLQLGPAVARLAADLSGDSALRSAAADFGWPTGSCLVNQDLKWDNVVVGGDGSTTLVDWELAGRGDPAWDLGCLLAEHLCRSTAPGTVDAGALALVGGYAEGARPRADVVAVLARRVVLAAALRLTQMAVEVVHTAQVATHPVVDGYLHLARAVLATGDTLTEEVSACLR